MKSVLISIQPKWCELIASGKKTVEVRKTKPKIDVPFKCYIYCTNGKEKLWVLKGTERAFAPEKIASICTAKDVGGTYQANGKVIGEFVCDRIYNITPHFDKPDFCNQYLCDWKWGEGTACLSFTEMNDYLKGRNGYAWHISDLVIYDKPKELSEFFQKCKSYDKDEWENDDCLECENPCGNGGKLYLKRPPQSWCYVEKLKGGE